MTDLLALDDIRAAAANIAGAAIRTPAIPSPGLSAVLGRRIVLKPEVLQPGGSFKPRGIAHKLALLTPAERARGLLTVSGGNHGLALARLVELVAQHHRQLRRGIDAVRSLLQNQSKTRNRRRELLASDVGANGQLEHVESNPRLLE